MSGIRRIFRRWTSAWICFYLRVVKGVEFDGGNPVFLGMPIVYRAPGARIVIGAGTQIVSSTHVNPAGVHHPVTLAALVEGSALIIGKGCGISGATIVARSTVTLEDLVGLGVNVTIYDNDFHAEDPADRVANRGEIPTAPVSIGRGAWIGANAMVLKGVTIGAWSIVGAGSVVTKSIGDEMVAAGNPARVLRPVRRAEPTA